MTPRFQRESPYYSACRRAPRARVSGTLAELLFGLRQGLSQGLSLGIPVSCAGCGRWETALCPRCLELLEGEPFAVDHADAAGDLDILALAAYAGPVRTMVLGWKNGSREDLSETMARAGRHLGSRWARTHPPGEIWPGTPGDYPGEDPATAVVTATSMPALLVVPAPSGPARRLRGRLVAARLADDVARAIADRWAHPEWADSSVRSPLSLISEPMPPPWGPSAPLVLSTDLLRRRGGGAHQAGRSSRQRRGNRSVVPRLLTPVTGLPIVLVDDVVTTGATLGACARAIEEAGGRVLGALAMAAAPPPKRRYLTVPAGTAARGAAAASTRIPGSGKDRDDRSGAGLSACGDQEAPTGDDALEKEA